MTVTMTVTMTVKMTDDDGGDDDGEDDADDDAVEWCRRGAAQCGEGMGRKKKKIRSGLGGVVHSGR